MLLIASALIIWAPIVALLVASNTATLSMRGFRPMWPEPDKLPERSGINNVLSTHLPTASVVSSATMLNVLYWANEFASLALCWSCTSLNLDLIYVVIPIAPPFFTRFRKNSRMAGLSIFLNGISTVRRAVIKSWLISAFALCCSVAARKDVDMFNGKLGLINSGGTSRPIVTIGYVTIISWYRPITLALSFSCLFLLLFFARSMSCWAYMFQYRVFSYMINHFSAKPAVHPITHNIHIIFELRSSLLCWNASFVILIYLIFTLDQFLNIWIKPLSC